jgi:hypothetical protein
MTNDNVLTTEDIKFLRWAHKKSRTSLFVSWTPHTQTGYANVSVEVRRDDVLGATEAIYTEHSRVLPLTG